MKGKTSGIGKLKISVSIISIISIIAVIACVIFANLNKKVTQTAESVKSEILRSLTYEQITKEEENAQNEYVKFLAFFTRDLDNDGYAEKLKGSCREISASDELYIELKVLTDGYLKDGVISLNAPNFTWKTSIISDNIVKGNYLGNTTSIKLQDKIDAGSQKLLWGTIKSNISNNINNYSDEATITLTGTHVSDDGVTETPINKTVKVIVDWYGSVGSSISGSTVSRNITALKPQDEEISVKLSFNTKEPTQKLLLKENVVIAEIPQLNGFDPISVSMSDEYTYDESTRIITATRKSSIDENGKITKTLARSNSYEITIKYPKEAYIEALEKVTLTFPIKTYYVAYNNSNEEFGSPLESKLAEDVVSLTYKKVEPPVVTPGTTPTLYSEFNVQVGNKTTEGNIISKEKPLQIYNEQVDETAEDYYTVQWEAYVSGNKKVESIIMKENPEKYADEFYNSSNYTSMIEYTENVGIYFSNAKKILGENGYINVYNDETNELLHTFTNEDWSKYSSSKVYKYENAVKHIRVETSEVVGNGELYVNHIKEINDELLVEKISKEDFDKLNAIYSYLQGNIKILDSEEIITKNAQGSAKYAEKGSRVELTASPAQIETQKTYNNYKLAIKTQKTMFNDSDWKNGQFIIEFPKEIIFAEINKITANNDKVKIVGYDLYEQDEKYLLKIITKNDEETIYTINVDCNITPDPSTKTSTNTFYLNAYNEIGEDYYRNKIDNYDVNGNNNRNERIGYSSDSISFIAPSTIITSQYISNFDDKETVKIAPNVVEVDRINKTANINLVVFNNYMQNIDEVKILGVIPTEKNSYIVNGKELGSEFSTTMNSNGIQVPDELKDVVNIYYSEKLNVTKDLNNSNNAWKKKPDDWSKVKSYLIDFGNYVISGGKSYVFNYGIDIPDVDKLNKVSYSEHAIFFALNTEGGKILTNTEPSKLGIRVVRNIGLDLTKYKAGTNKTVGGATYKLVENNEDLKMRILTTNENGKIVIDNICVDRKYSLSEINSPENYSLNDEVIEFEVVEDEQRNLKLESNSSKVTFDGEKVIINVENEAKYNVLITKTDLSTKEFLADIIFVFNGKAYTTDSEGKITLEKLEVNKEYVLTETQATDYYILDDITFKLVRNTEGQLEIQSNNSNFENCSVVNSEDNDLVEIGISLENEKIPTYNLEILKIEESSSQNLKVLKDAKFRLEYQDLHIEKEFITDQNGKFQVEGLYQYVDGKYITGRYILQELVSPEGYANYGEEIYFRVKRNANGSLSAEIDDKTNLKSINNVKIDGNTVQIIIQNKPNFKLLKTDLETGEPLANAKFIIYELNNSGNQIGYAKDINGNYLGEKNDLGEYIVTTDESGAIVCPIKDGIYQAVEVGTPEGYEEEIVEEYFEISNKVKNSGSNSSSGSYMSINYIEDLITLSNNVANGNTYSGKTITLMRDLDFNDSGSYRSASNTIYGDYNGNGTVESLKTELTTGKGFARIGNYDSYFSGNFDGQGYEIRNLYSDITSCSGGLFSRIINASIKNLKVTGYVTGMTNTGIIVGDASNSIIENCKAEGTADSYTYKWNGCFSGGIVGLAQNQTTIKNCSVEYGDTLNLDATYNGVIVGKVVNSYVINCYNKCNIYVRGGIGGIVGIVGENATIKNCYNMANIVNKAEGEFIAGGILGSTGAGYAATSSYVGISNCYNIGNIYGYDGSSSSQYIINYAGGIIGKADSSYSNEVSVKDCYNVGYINSNYYCGGIIGYNSANLILKYNYNIGNISSSDENSYAGSIVGYLSSNLSEEMQDNNYYLDSINISGTNKNTVGTQLSSEYMQTREFYIELNQNGAWLYRKNEYPKLLMGLPAEIKQVTTLNIRNTIKKYNITTEIVENLNGNREGGMITGLYTDDYKESGLIKFVEAVKHGDSNHEKIEIEPNQNYEIVDILVNGKQIEYTVDQNGKVTLPKEYFKNVIEDKHITVAFERKDNLIITKVDEQDNNLKLAGAKFRIDMPIQDDLNDLIGDIQHGSNSTTTHHFEKNGEKYVSTNAGIANSVSNSYFPIDLREYPNNNFTLNINASISSESVSYDYGYARVTTSETVPAYSDTTGEIMKIGGTSVLTQTYSKTLQGGNLYYLHIGYRKDGSVNSGDDKFTINSINLTSSETLERVIEVETNADGIASVAVPTNLEINITETAAPKGYQLDSTLQKITLVSGEVKELTFTNKILENADNLKITKVDADDNNIKLEGVEFEITPNDISDVLGTITNNGTYAFNENNGVFTSNNKGIDSSTANSYIKVDLTENTGKFKLIVNAQVSSETNNDIGFAAVTENTTAPTFGSVSVSGQFIKISGTSNTPNNYSYNLDGGKVYYLHFAYLKNSSGFSGDDLFTINSVQIEAVLEKAINPIRVKTNNEGIAKVVLAPGKYKLKEVKTVDGYILNEEPQTILITDEKKELTINNTIKKFNITTKVERTPAQKVDGGTISGKDEQLYEEVRYSQQSTKDILIDPDDGYKIVSIKVNGKSIDFVSDENGNVLLDKFTEVKEDKEVVVKFEPIYESNFTLVKQDDVTKQPLEGIQFEIYYLSVGNDFAKDRNGFYIGQKDANGRYFVTTDSKGEVKLSLPTGLYKAVEVKGVNGYVLPEKEEDRTIYFRVLANADIEINYIEDLIDLSNNVTNGNTYTGKVISLTRDLDFNNPKSYKNANDTTTYGDYNGNGIVETIKEELTNKLSIGFKPIGGNPDMAFSGIFDGNCFEIKNIFINSSYAALFTYISNGELLNLKLVNANITNSSCGGGFAYYCTNSRIYNCGIDGIVKSSTNYPTGGLIYTTNNSEIISCYNNADISGVCLGGISSYITNTLIDNCYNAGDLTSTGPVGGIGYSISNCIVKNCYNTGDINGRGCSGGISNSISDSVIECCYNIGKINESSAPASGFAYSISNCKITDFYNAGDVTGPSCVDGIAYSISNSNLEKCYNKGNLLSTNWVTAGISYTISNSTFKECYNTGNVNSEYSAYEDTIGSAGFAIIFTNSVAEKCFNEGTITSKGHGAGFALKIDDSDLEKCYNKGDIITKKISTGIANIANNCNFINVYNKGNISGYGGYSSGIVVTANNSAFDKCHNSGNVFSGPGVAGIVAHATECIITRCYNEGTVNGEGGAAGFVYNVKNSLVQDCYNKGETQSKYCIGGMFYSTNLVTINNCYNIGTGISGNDAGGIVRYGDSNSSINNCYSTTKFNNMSEPRIGGIILYRNSATIKNTYYLNTTALSGIYNTSDTKGVTEGKENLQMLSKAFVNQLNSNKDLISTTIPLSNWKYNQGGYPVLDYEIEIYEYNTSTKQEENTSGNTSTGNTTDADFEINYIEDLIDLSNNVTNGNTYEGKKIVLTRNLDFKDVNSYRNQKDKTTYGDYNGNGIVETIKDELVRGFKPIGGTPDKAFKGNFDGNGFELKNLYIDTTYAALFTYILDGELLNLKLANANMTNSGCGVGFAYLCTNSKIYNCGIDGIVRSSSNAPTAGIVYTTNNSEIINCYNNADISGVNTAGISSYIYNSLIENCYNTGDLISVGPIGGIAYSMSNCIVKNCYNIGDITGKGCSGGIASSISDSIIENSYNVGDIIDTSAPAGGLAYNISNCEIYNCYNTGNVTGKAISGGIGSTISNSIIKDSYNTGNVTDNSGPAGGLAYSISNCEVSNFYNAGDVFSNSGAGGIAQSISKSTLNECYNEGDISSTTNCAAGIGLWITESDFKECYNKGNIISEYTNSSDTTGAAGFAITFTKSTAEKCFNEGNVTSKYHGAGFALRLDNSNLNDCYNKGIINANSYAGGIIYISIDSELKNLYNQGQVVSNSPNAGITYSASNCTIEQCANMETLKSNAPSAGIVYTASNSNIVKCYNKGNVYGLAVAGGIAYTTSNTIIQDCYNEGNVYSNNPVGGIVYSAYSTIINNCYNTGKLSGNYCIGGIAYSSDEKSSINNCYNTGELITGSSTTGEPIAGIVYSGTMSTLKDTYYLDTTAKSGLYNVADSEGNVQAKTEAEMKSEDFVNLLNENKSSIETEIPLSNWKYNSEGYPVLDFEIDKYDYNTNIPTNKPNYENVDSQLGITNSKSAKITVHHYLEGTGPEFEKTPVILASDEVMVGKENYDYSTSPKLNIENYNLIKDENGEYIIPENASGKYTLEDQHIYYYYNVKPLELTVHHYLGGTEDKLSEDEKYFFNENDHYKTTPSEEVLEAYEVTLVEGTEEKDITENEVVTYYYKKKEYKITAKVEIPESEKEAGRTENGGTILGEGENPYEIVKHGEDSTKDIIATPIDGYKISSITVNGKVVPFTIQGGVITLDKFEKMTEDKEVIVVFEPIVGKVITHHYIQGTTEKLHDDIINVEKVGGVVNTKPIDIEDYKLVSSAGNKDEDGNVVITKETHEGVEEIIYYYQKAYKITTDVIEHQESYKDGTIKEAVKGGSITDEDVVIHEQVVKYEDSVKVIEIKPDEGYEIVKVQVNGKAIDLKGIDENGNLTLPEGFFKDVEEDIHVEVEFRKVSKVIVKHLEKDTETELSDTTEIVGYEGKEFETTEKIIPFYTLVKEEATDENGEVKETVKITDENKEAIEPNGTMFSDDITIIYWYEKVDANVIERHIEVNAKGEEKELDFIIHDDDTVASVEILRKEYEDYTSIDVPEEIKKKIEENSLNVIFVSKDDNKVTVTVNSGNVTEVWYYYIKQYNITTEVKTHKETVNGTETDVEGGTISKQYKIDENGEEVEDVYEVVNSRADSTKEIKMVPDDGYRIKSVTINDIEIYIDNMVAEDGSLLLPEAYFVDVQEDYHVVVEFERIPAKVIVKYIDEYTKESILDDKVVEGFVNIEYDEPRAEIEDYISAEPEPTNAKGKMTEEAITITYFYKKQFKVTTDVKEHEETDKDGNKVIIKGGKITGEDEAPLEIVSRGEASTKIIKAEPDSGYRVSKLTINDIPYDFRHMLNDKGILSIPVFENVQEDKHIIVEFERIPAQIIVKHIDEETGEELTNQEIIKGFVNGDYSTNSKEFAGYQLNVNKLPINANGKMTEEAIVIIYYYNKLKIPEENITPEIPDQPIEIPEYIPEFKPQHNNPTHIENVKTGDNIFGYAILLVVSIVGIILIIIGKNKKK